MKFSSQHRTDEIQQMLTVIIKEILRTSDQLQGGIGQREEEKIKKDVKKKGEVVNEEGGGG
jgi:hypothetical protein